MKQLIYRKGWPQSTYATYTLIWSERNILQACAKCGAGIAQILHSTEPSPTLPTVTMKFGMIDVFHTLMHIDVFLIFHERLKKNQRWWISPQHHSFQRCIVTEGNLGEGSVEYEIHVVLAPYFVQNSYCSSTTFRTSLKNISFTSGKCTCYKWRLMSSSMSFL